jgi:aspartate/methionine/tyrosine aminotransferase
MIRTQPYVLERTSSQSDVELLAGLPLRTTGGSSRLSRAASRGFDRERWLANSLQARPGLAALHSGDPCFPTPQHIVEAVEKAVADGYTHYAPALGDSDLRKAIVDAMSSGSAHRYEPDEVLITVGASEAIYCTIAALLDPGDEVILFNPTYSLYAPIARQIGAKPVFVTMTPDFHVDPVELRSAITKRTRVLVVNNPANPTGVVFTKSDLAVIADVAQAYDLVVVADEVYDHLVFDGQFTSTKELPELADRLVYINSFSKTYAMTGWRLGWLAAPKDIVRGCEVIHRNCVTAVPWPTQRGALAALQGSQDAVELMIAGYRQRREILIAGLHDTPGLEIVGSQGTFFAFLRFRLRQRLKSSEFASHLFERGVAVRSGTEYGTAGEGHLRVCFSVDIPELQTGVDRIHRTFEELA